MSMNQLFTLVSKNGHFATLEVESNGDAEYCNANTVRLVEATSNDVVVWVVNTREQAEHVLNNPAEWYNSGLSHPMVSKDDGWQVFCMSIC